MSRVRPLIPIVAIALVWVIVLLGNPTLSHAAPASGVHPLTKTDADAWLDGAAPALLEQGELPGVTISIVQGGKLVTARGFGTVDRPTRFHDGATPVDPARHLFRIGSATKLFTAVAAMQLVEQGKLDLDADVQPYLDFPLDVHQGKVTIRHLMTHSAGFEEYMGHGFMVGSPDELRPLDEVVRDMPRQVHTPGTVTSYSNHSTALLGYIVQRVSGEKYADYVERHILQPLGMTHTSASQPLPDALAPDMSGGFQAVDEPAAPFEHISVAPAGAISSTATDMAAFANFALGHDPKILKPETLALMQKPALDPATAGAAASASETMGLQFWLGRMNGVRQVNHAGDTNVFHTMLMLFPDQDMGIFISQNGNGNGDVDMRVLAQAFADRYVAAPRPVGPAVATAPQDAARVAGAYTLSRQQYSGILKVTGPLGQFNVRADADGTLIGPGFKFRETAPGVWTLIESRNLLITQLTEGEPGDPRLGAAPAHTLIRVPWWEQQLVVASGAVFWLVASLWAFVAGIAGAVRRRRLAKAGQPDAASRAVVWTRRLTPCAICAPLSIVMVMLFLTGMQNLAPVDAFVHLAHVFAVLAVVATVAALVRTVLAVRGREGWKAIVGNGVLTVALTLFVVQAVHFNVLQLVVRY